MLKIEQSALSENIMVSFIENPRKRNGYPRPIALAIKFLIEDGFVNGESIDVNDGLTIRQGLFRVGRIAPCRSGGSSGRVCWKGSSRTEGLVGRVSILPSGPVSFLKTGVLDRVSGLGRRKNHQQWLHHIIFMFVWRHHAIIRTSLCCSYRRLGWRPGISQ
nr:hypothetical protein [uncultured Cohaesibacter sp.]